MPRKNNPDAEHLEKLKKLSQEREIHHREVNEKTRARSLTVGTAGGGILEISLRSDYYGAIWYQLHPVEAVEVIGQIAAAAGLEVGIRPRKDFATWRPWDSPLPGSVHWMGTAAYQLKEEEQRTLFEMKKEELEGKRDTNNLLPPQEK